jgi:hypothetical protein
MLGNMVNWVKLGSDVKRTMLSKILMLILAASILASIAYWPITAEAQLPLPPGIPRGDVLVIENHYGTHADPENFNYLVPGRPGFGASGFSQVCAIVILYYQNISPWNTLRKRKLCFNCNRPVSY